MADAIGAAFSFGIAAPSIGSAISKSGARFCVRSRSLQKEAHDLIAKPRTLWRIMRWDDGYRYGRTSFHGSIGAQSAAGDCTALVLHEPVPRLARSAPLHLMHQIG